MRFLEDFDELELKDNRKIGFSVRRFSQTVPVSRKAVDAR
jgi:hypothetical protein